MKYSTFYDHKWNTNFYADGITSKMLLLTLNHGYINKLSLFNIIARIELKPFGEQHQAPC